MAVKAGDRSECCFGCASTSRARERVGAGHETGQRLGANRLTAYRLTGYRLTVYRFTGY